MPVPRHLVEQIKQLIPPLNGSLHKGQSGRVAVLGGALDYTGAPYFASMSSLRMGADLAHVICSPTAAGAIKSYAPDLIVHPILRSDMSEDALKPELDSLLSRLHVLVVGPGLGREVYMQNFARLAVSLARKRSMYLVLDADALWMVGQDLNLIKGYHKVVLTPNVMEFKRLSDQVHIDPKTPPKEQASLMSKAFGGATVLQKGPTDIISVNTSTSDVKTEIETVEVDIEGGLKRCGGQGDILSGAVGTFLAWGKCYEDGAFGDGSLPSARIPILSAIGGSTLTRTVSRIAFAQNGRSVITADMIPSIGTAFAEIFGKESQVGKL
ncbi:Ribokinase-like protein [Rickenella mellea]|uniref:ATP-dependent (S)-NAD(P)H-hydrate dehydratase n=1 Tax=Rickenella mellea TaxID=50990 RepID=A0A4Y7QFZ3_9AGAM|nr:Ribokinase-like protein [Rickenella mellea]